MWLLALAAIFASAAAAPSAPCQITGNWADRNGGVMLLVLAADDTLTATSVYGSLPGGVKSATGRAAADASSLWLQFGSTNLSASLVNECAGLWFGSGPGDNTVYGLASTSAQPLKVERVHLVNMAHLDLGYTDLARNVCDLYQDILLPLNLLLADVMRNTSTPFALTTHSLLVQEYIDGSAQCAHSRPNASAITAFEEAIRRGDVMWHAQSANYFPEAMDAASFLAMLDSVDALSARYGVHYGRTLFKSTDTPGLSRAIIPLLNARGRRAIHSGANGKCTMSKLPGAFMWVDAQSNTSVLALMSNGYGGTFVVGSNALIINYQGDNAPPPLPPQVAQSFADAQKAYPGSTVILSSLDDFADAALASPEAAQLGRYTGEVGNSWLYGLPSDAVKVSQYRETLRVVQLALNGSLSNPALQPDDADLLSFRSRLLISTPEHNGGVSIGEFLPSEREPSGHWSNAKFDSVFNQSNFQFVQSSYDEKRAFLAPLPSASPSQAWASFLTAREAALKAIVPVAPDLTGFARVADPSQPLACAGSRLSVAFAADGSLSRLVDIASGHDWVNASVGGPLRFSYRTYDEADFAAFNRNYTPTCGVPCINFAKVGMDSAQPVSREWPAALTALWLRQGGSGAACSAVAQLALDAQTMELYGGAASVWLRVDVDVAGLAPGAAPALAASLTLLGKRRSRMAESGWLSFPEPSARAADRGAWRMHVLGSEVDPAHAALWGARWLYAVDPAGDASYSFRGAPGGGAVARYAVRSLDAALATPGADTSRLVGYAGADVPGKGVAFNLWSNVWGSTFCQWFGSDSMFRFVLSLDASSA